MIKNAIAECSLLVNHLPVIMGNDIPLTTVRCDEKGSFNLIQCLNDACVCVDEIDGRPTSTVFNLTLGLSDMPCCKYIFPLYNTMIFNNILSSFTVDRATHRNSTFLRQCEIEKMERLAQRKEFEEAGITVIDFSEDFCQPDGFYAPVQKNTSHVFCSDQYGRQIKDYVLERIDSTSKNMNCS